VTHLLRSLIRETLLLEEVYGAQAVVYHGTKADPQKLISALLNDEFRPGEGAGSMYGKGLYAVYDPKGAQTMTGGYGNYIIKLKVNLYGYIIFDSDTAQKVYGSALTPVEQAQKLGYSSITLKELKGLRSDISGKYTSNAALEVHKSLRSEVKGLVFTGRNDGRVVVVYDPTTIVPVAWKRVGGEWQKADRVQAGFRPAARRSATGEYEEGKYDEAGLKTVRTLFSLPRNKRIVTGSLDLSDKGITSLPSDLKVSENLTLSFNRIVSLPAGLHVMRNLDIDDTKITRIPADLRVGGDLNAKYSPVTSLPAGLQVGGDLDLTYTPIASLPKGLKVGGSLSLGKTNVVSIPEDLQVGRSLYLNLTPITSLPANLKVNGALDITGTRITSLPSGLQIGIDLYLDGASITTLPEDLEIGHLIWGFKGDRSKIPSHLKDKLR
jgi:hypothetical protein